MQTYKKIRNKNKFFILKVVSRLLVLHLITKVVLQWINQVFYNCNFFVAIIASVSIPKGCILGIITTQLVYVIQMIWFTSAANRYATGNLADYPYDNYSCDLQQQCTNGLSNDQYMMSTMSSFTYFASQTHNVEPIYCAGLLSQSFSSAMIAFISAPRILQVFCHLSIIQ